MKSDNPQTTLSDDGASFIEGYATALWSLALALGWRDGHCKSYDPMSIKDGVLHSYVFDMKDGGRHHPISDYKDKEEVCDVLLQEAISWKE